MKVLITGASGFVGKALLQRLLRDGRHEIVASIRKRSAEFPAPVTGVEVGDLDASTDWSKALTGVNAVVHCAGRVHVMNDTVGDPLSEYRRVNLHGTINLARQALAHGVSRFIFLSTIKVNGEATSERPFRAVDETNPTDPYAISKWETEVALLKMATETELEVVIIRPPLVYGPGVKANFHSMINWLYKGVPLPLGSVHNRRSMVGIENLVDLIVTTLEHQNAANQVFLVSDDKSLSTTELLIKIGTSLGRRPHLLPVPVELLKASFSLVGKKSMIEKLSGSLEVDITKNKELLNWSPKVSIEDQLSTTVAHFLKERTGK